jgi:hypothetical protein
MMIGKIGIMNNTNNIHYVFGLRPDFGGKPWSYCHYLSVKSAATINSGSNIYFWHEHEPEGEWWDKSKQYLILKPIKAPTSIFDRPLLHHAHKADVIRLLALKEFGGTYIDSDVICLKPFDTIQHCGFWGGKQYDYGLCNATMGGCSGALFIDLWLDTFKTFRSQGWDQYWDEHAVKIPRQLSQIYPNLVTVLDQELFFWPFCHQIKDIFESDKPKYLQRSYSVHLWETISWNWLSQLTPDTINRNSELGIILQENNII